MNELIELWIKRANEQGSSATTLRGALSWFKKHAHKSEKLPLDKTGNRFFAPHRFKSRIALFSDEERLIRRSIDDKKFRRKIVRETKKQLNNLCKPLSKYASLSDITAYEDNRKSLNDKLIVLNTRLSRISKSIYNYNTLPESIGHVLLGASYGTEDIVTFARKLKCPLNFQAIEAKLYFTIKSSGLVSEPGKTYWKNGKPVRYEHAVRNNYIRSFGVIRDSQTLEVAFHTKEIVLVLPDKYKWDVDNFGVKAVSKENEEDDYHININDVLFSFPVTTIIDNLLRNKRKREDLEREDALMLDSSKDVYVCFKDSLNAGNCLAGTTAFISNNRLDSNKHYPVAMLLKAFRKQENESRVRLAIKSAYKRHDAELKQGYSILDNHITI
jgi:hypothetical protein